MSFSLYHKAKKVPLPHAQKAVLKELAICAKDDGSNAFPSAAEMSQNTGYSTRTIRTALKELKAMKLVADSGERVGRTGRIPIWQINLHLIRNPEDVSALNGDEASSFNAEVDDGNAEIGDGNAEISVGNAEAASYVYPDISLNTETPAPDSQITGAGEDPYPHAPNPKDFVPDFDEMKAMLLNV